MKKLYLAGFVLLFTPMIASAQEEPGGCSDSSYWDALYAQCDAGADSIRASADWICDMIDEVRASEDVDEFCDLLCKDDPYPSLCRAACKNPLQLKKLDQKFREGCLANIGKQADEFAANCKAGVDAAKAAYDFLKCNLGGGNPGATPPEEQPPGEEPPAEPAQEPPCVDEYGNSCELPIEEPSV